MNINLNLPAICKYDVYDKANKIGDATCFCKKVLKFTWNNSPVLQSACSNPVFKWVGFNLKLKTWFNKI